MPATNKLSKKDIAQLLEQAQREVIDLYDQQEQVEGKIETTKKEVEKLSRQLAQHQPKLEVGTIIVSHDDIQGCGVVIDVDPHSPEYNVVAWLEKYEGADLCDQETYFLKTSRTQGVILTSQQLIDKATYVSDIIPLKTEEIYTEYRIPDKLTALIRHEPAKVKAIAKMLNKELFADPDVDIHSLIGVVYPRNKTFYRVHCSTERL